MLHAVLHKALKDAVRARPFTTSEPRHPAVRVLSGVGVEFRCELADQRADGLRTLTRQAFLQDEQQTVVLTPLLADVGVEIEEVVHVLGHDGASLTLCPPEHHCVVGSDQFLHLQDGHDVVATFAEGSGNGRGKRPVEQQPHDNSRWRRS